MKGDAGRIQRQEINGCICLQTPFVRMLISRISVKWFVRLSIIHLSPEFNIICGESGPLLTEV